MKLAKREKLFIGVAAGIFGIFLILQLLVIPYFEKKNRLAKETETLEQIIKDMDRLGTGGQGISEISGSLERVLAARKETLSTLIYKEAESIGIQRNNIAGMDTSEGNTQDGYQEDILEVRLSAITLPQLTQFLIRIEKPEKYIFINRIKIGKNKKEEGYLDAEIRIMSYIKES